MIVVNEKLADGCLKFLGANKNCHTISREKSPYWDLIIFANLTADHKWPNVNYINLRNVNDFQYPPQKKSFAALRHIANHYAGFFLWSFYNHSLIRFRTRNFLDKIDWYFRVDDDSMLLPQHFEQFLSIELECQKLVWINM